MGSRQRGGVGRRAGSDWLKKNKTPTDQVCPLEKYTGMCDPQNLWFRPSWPVCAAVCYNVLTYNVLVKMTKNSERKVGGPSDRQHPRRVVRSTILCRRGGLKGRLRSSAFVVLEFNDGPCLWPIERNDHLHTHALRFSFTESIIVWCARAATFVRGRSGTVCQELEPLSDRQVLSNRRDASTGTATQQSYN